MVKVFSNVPPEDVKAMADILSRIVGTPIEPTGDIEVVVDGQRYMIKSQEGGQHYGAAVQR
jgi:hypothetical protein